VELLVPRCAGLDVAKDEVVACVRVPDGQGGRRQEVRTYPTFTSGLEALADWLTAEGVTQVVMEATGQQLGSRCGGCWRSGVSSCWGSTPATSRSCRAARHPLCQAQAAAAASSASRWAAPCLTGS
jgi:hypothetical protein